MYANQPTIPLNQYLREHQISLKLVFKHFVGLPMSFARIAIAFILLIGTDLNKNVKTWAIIIAVFGFLYLIYTGYLFASMKNSYSIVNLLIYVVLDVVLIVAAVNLLQNIDTRLNDKNINTSDVWAPNYVDPSDIKHNNTMTRVLAIYCLATSSLNIVLSVLITIFM
jgi:hypothetical protein